MTTNTCEKCGIRPVQVEQETDGFSIAMLKTGHLVCGECFATATTKTAA